LFLRFYSCRTTRERKTICALRFAFSNKEGVS
jgi:hypothetical protein